MNTFKHKLASIFACICISVLLGGPVCASQGDGLIVEIDKLATADDATQKEVDESLVVRIESSSTLVTDSLLPRLADPKATEKQLAIYAWALGLSGDPRSIDPLISLSKQTKSEWVKSNCYRALASMNGDRVGEFLCVAYDTTEDGEKQYELLDLLAQMQYVPALSRTEKILKMDPEQYYWRSIFIFGKMGDKAVPFLLAKIADPDQNVRTNAIHVLGNWLLATEAVQPLRGQFWKEKDTQIRLLILNALERTTVDQQMLKDFSAEVVAKEKDGSVKKYAQETIDQQVKMQQSIETFKKEKKVSPEDYKRQYDQIFKSAGKKGDYKVIATASAPGDESTLKKLREHILQRNSDECFHDYQKINEVIMFNRLIQSVK
jgi:hypothetical protein